MGDLDGSPEKRSTFWTLETCGIQTKMGVRLRNRILLLQVNSTEHKTNMEIEKLSSIWEIEKFEILTKFAGVF